MHPTQRLSLFLSAVVCFVTTFAVCHSVQAATITVVNLDGANEGFNDPTPAVPVGSNPGTTVGAQRLNAFQFAADLWGARLDSAVVITVGANFDPLSCSQFSGVLGSSGPKIAQPRPPRKQEQRSPLRTRTPGPSEGVLD